MKLLYYEYAEFLKYESSSKLYVLQKKQNNVEIWSVKYGFVEGNRIIENMHNYNQYLVQMYILYTIVHYMYTCI